MSDTQGLLYLQAMRCFWRVERHLGARSASECQGMDMLTIQLETARVKRDTRHPYTRDPDPAWLCLLSEVPPRPVPGLQQPVGLQPEAAAGT
jgi:hypothetical protein